jgi:polyisoprenoid-binding protein YceI
MMSARPLIFLFLFVCGRLAAADTGTAPPGVLTFKVDPAKSTVQFTLGAVLHTVRGSFKVRSGAIRFHPATGKIGGQVTVDVRSGNTGEAARDRQMHANVLESDRFPEAAFLPDSVNGRVAAKGESAVEVHGTLRLHGRDHEMTIPVKVQIRGDTALTRAKFAVPYVSWGMKDPSTFVLQVDKSVNVEVTLEGH